MTQELFHCAIDLAQRAGKITLEYFRSQIEVEVKHDHSPVTIADQKAEEFLRTEIEKQFPEDGILGEEFGEKKGNSGRRWILDPIDGTKTFIRGVAMYGTQIGIEQDGQSLIGVVRYPPNEITLAAMMNAGCFCNGERCAVSNQQSLSESTLLATAMDGILHRWGEEVLLQLLKQTGLQRTWGDCYGYYLLVTGRADIMIDPTMHRWDIAALYPIVHEAGGQATDHHGHRPHQADHLIATNGWLHQPLLQILNQQGA